MKRRETESLRKGNARAQSAYNCWSAGVYAQGKLVKLAGVGLVEDTRRHVLLTRLDILGTTQPTTATTTKGSKH